MDLERTIEKHSDQVDLIQVLKREKEKKRVKIPETGEKEVKTGKNKVYSIKVINGDGIGTISAGGTKDIGEQIKKAIKISKINTGYQGLIKEPKNKSSALEKLGQDMHEPKIEEYIDKIEEAKKYEDKDTKIESAGLLYGHRKREYLDTFGNHEKYEKTSSSSWAKYLTDKKDKGTYFESEFSYKDPYSNFLENCEKASEKSKKQAHKKEEKGERNLVFRKGSLYMLLRYGLAYYFNAYRVNRGLSEIEIGQKIGPEDLKLLNSGTLKDGAKTNGFDREGTKKQETTLINNGEVKSYLHNDYTSKLYNTSSTGNSASLSNRSIIKMDNTIIEPGEGLGDRDIIIDRLTPNLDKSTGDYSFEVTTAWTEDGKGIKNFVFQGNLFEDLKELKIGKEKKKQRPGIRSPNLMLEGKEIEPK